MTESPSLADDSDWCRKKLTETQPWLKNGQHNIKLNEEMRNGKKRNPVENKRGAMNINIDTAMRWETVANKGNRQSKRARERENEQIAVRHTEHTIQDNHFSIENYPITVNEPMFMCAVSIVCRFCVDRTRYDERYFFVIFFSFQSVSLSLWVYLCLRSVSTTIPPYRLKCSMLLNRCVCDSASVCELWWFDSCFVGKITIAFFGR